MAPSAGRPFVLAAGAVASVVAFRVGVLPGGLVGVDVAAALVGWWFASTVVRGAAFGELVGLVWRRTWPALLLAVAMTVVWVLITPSTRLDAVVRGQVLAAFTASGNWHQLAHGPLEVPARPLASPLQHLWALAVLVQGGVVGPGIVGHPAGAATTGARDPLGARGGGGCRGLLAGHRGPGRVRRRGPDPAAGHHRPRLGAVPRGGVRRACAGRTGRRPPRRRAGAPVARAGPAGGGSGPGVAHLVVVASRRGGRGAHRRCAGGGRVGAVAAGTPGAVQATVGRSMDGVGVALDPPRARSP